MELLDAHGSALSGFDWLVKAIGPDDWARATPCPGWTVRDLLGHLVAEQLWVPPLLDGAGIDEVGERFDGDVLGDDPVGAWTRASADAREAWLRPGALDREVHLSYGLVPAAEFGWQMTLDLAVHGWDLAEGIGETSPLHDELAEALLAVFSPQVWRWQGTGIFAPPVPVSVDAGAPARLLGLVGRHP
ncbi:TIGR03086 family protein [Actinosynnema sp. ALI-1.44]|uniref:TIGR03086 family metal-binding protein n=1 Tax=Actinosynnema sp. ALI-1.44 TaxID=1933779 RepID=UPI00097C9CB9|nr:TIGR03086 family metal-binding protein [Actinosynnema sp. ALI-1.44]ONI87476.1 TIGR03086 family protein [Actinosynnema sp. ALI-1.44]